jgi:acetyl-CoA carboxylase biotin carboxyl carrier protein
VVCILEAMKVFSEIKAEIAGMIERILVKNGEAVEYGQPLFLVRAT